MTSLSAGHYAILLATLFALSASLTWVMMRLSIMDVPVARSSHRAPTPKAGGVAISLTFLAGMGVLVLFFVEVEPSQGLRLATFLILTLAILLFALRDDLRPEPLLRKLVVQAVCATAFGIFVADVPQLDLPGLGVIEFYGLGSYIAAAWILLFMNAFNFMDGLNGLASGAAVVAAAVFGIIADAAGNGLVCMASFSVAAATAGFFVFNFPSGRIFMGETGSQVLGFVLAGLALFAFEGGQGQVSVFVLPVIFYPFLFDVLLTLLRRLLRGENIFLGHREHLYQLLHQAGLSHRQVTTIYIALVAGCAVLAAIVQAAPDELKSALVLAPLPVLAILYAGTLFLIRGEEPGRLPPIRFRRADGVD